MTFHSALRESLSEIDGTPYSIPPRTVALRGIPNIGALFWHRNLGCLPKPRMVIANKDSNIHNLLLSHP